MMGCLECLECGDVAIEKEDDVWQPDEEFACPECGTRYIVNVSEDGIEVWLSRAEG